MVGLPQLGVLLQGQIATVSGVTAEVRCFL